MCDPVGSDMRGHVRNTFRQLSMFSTRDAALIPTHNHEVLFREKHIALHNGTCRIAYRYFTLPEVKQLRYPRFPACTLLLIPHHRCSRDLTT